MICVLYQYFEQLLVSKGESDVDDKRNISNTSSRGSMTSFTNTTRQSRPNEEVKKTTERKTKVSFATDDSMSFETSPSSSNRSRVEPFMRSPKQSHNTHQYGRFVKETSAFRAAMDYGYDDDDDDDEQSPGKLSSSGQSRKLQEPQMYQTRHVHGQDLEGTNCSGSTSVIGAIEVNRIASLNTYIKV